MRKKLLAALALSATLAFLSFGSVLEVSAQGPPPSRQPGPPPWDASPRGYRDIESRGYRDGIEGARKDFGNHRRPDVNNRDEYRKPDVASRDRPAYRAAFRRGYNVGVQHYYYRGRRP